MSGIALIVCFVVAVAIMIVLISKFGVHPFIAIMLVSLALAIVAGIDLVKVPAIIGEGFSGIFKSNKFNGDAYRTLVAICRGSES